MSAIWAVAVNTWRESIRDRVLYSLFFFSAVVIVISLGAKDLSIGDVDKVVRSVAFGAIRLLRALFDLLLWARSLDARAFAGIDSAISCGSLIGI